MKIVCVTSSPRVNGNSAALAGMLLEGLPDAELRRYHLWDLQFKGCRGCMACRKTSEICVARDDASPVLEDIARADVTILASPIYLHAVNGEMKSLVDRFFSFMAKDHFRRLAAGEMYFPTRLATGKTIVLALAHGRPADFYHFLDAALRDIMLDKGFSAVEILRGGLLNSARDIHSREDLREKARELAATLRARYGATA
ncbi:MAG: flavodoxin family protein [Desulfovibrio sp.]|jgi:multimeric flavodoxin WrbA|nr:flavodoxin family protein [Desulfovibrio sp.]